MKTGEDKATDLLTPWSESKYWCLVHDSFSSLGRVNNQNYLHEAEDRRLKTD